MTPHEFAAIRKRVGIDFGPDRPAESFPNEKARAVWQIRWLSWLVNVTPRNVSRWQKPSNYGPHPTAVRIIEWALAGHMRPDVPDRSMTGEDFAIARESLNLTQEDMASIIGIDADLLDQWESERGPHPSACAVMSWLLAGWVPPATA